MKNLYGLGYLICTLLCLKKGSISRVPLGLLGLKVKILAIYGHG